MVTGFIAALLAAQASPANSCVLVTPRGDAIEFRMSRVDGGAAQLEPMAGSAWPLDAVASQSGESRNRFEFSNGFTLELSGDNNARQSATLLRRDEGRALPAAFGFCADGRDGSGGIEASPARASAPGAFDPELWPARECWVVLNDGRRLRFFATFFRQSEIDFTSPDMWAGASVAARITRRSDNGLVTQFRREGGPSGAQVIVPGRTRAVALWRFASLGDAGAGSQGGYGICGMNNLIRRAVQQ